MKKYSFTAIATGIAWCILSFLLAQCNPSSEGNASDTASTEAIPATEVTVPQTDTMKVVETPPTQAPATTPAVTPAPPATNNTKPAATKSTTQKPAATTPAKKAKPVEAAKPTPSPKNEQPATPTEGPKTTKPEPTAPPVAPAPKVEKAPSAPVQRSTAFSFKSVKGNIHGSSTLHDWDSQVTKMEGKGSFQTKDNELVALKDVEIKIDVKGIKSKEGKKMDDKTFETFRSDKYPNIIYTFSSAQVKIDASNSVTIEAAGNLSMAGATKPVTLTATGKQLPNGDLQLSVSKKLKMTDYKMEPPVMMLGTIKVGNEITVSFDFILSKN